MKYWGLMLAMALLALPATAQGMELNQLRFVSPTGSDAAAGSERAPWRTVNGAIEKAGGCIRWEKWRNSYGNEQTSCAEWSAEHPIYVEPGTYKETAVVNAYDWTTELLALPGSVKLGALSVAGRVLLGYGLETCLIENGGLARSSFLEVSDTCG